VVGVADLHLDAFEPERNDQPAVVQIAGLPEPGVPPARWQAACNVASSGSVASTTLMSMSERSSARSSTTEPDTSASSDASSMPR
jgi:hypothetical protein